MKHRKPTKRTWLFLAIISLFFTQIINAQSIEVNGKVVDGATQTPIEGASVLIKNSAKGTRTNTAGEFTLSVDKNSKLVVTSVGYDNKEFLATSSYIKIQINTNSRQLSEVMVTATGIKKESRRLGYAIQTIDASTLTMAREADPVNSLKGNSAGLSININQEIGHAPDVIMRGENAAEDRPMFVVDGVPISSDTYNIVSSGFYYTDD